MPKQARPWYADGLQFTCTQCGNCCTGAPGYVWVTQEEIGKTTAAAHDLRGAEQNKVNVILAGAVLIMWGYFSRLSFR